MNIEAWRAVNDCACPGIVISNFQISTFDIHVQRCSFSHVGESGLWIVHTASMHDTNSLAFYYYISSHLVWFPGSYILRAYRPISTYTYLMESNGQLSAESSISEPIAIDVFKIPPYWYEDGDIFLLVEDDNQMEHKFRIHRLMLCLHSPVFRDMFSLGENLNVGKEGDIPTVPMKGDSVEDVKELLKVIYKGL